MEFSIVIPSKDEAKRIPKLLEEIGREFTPDNSQNPKTEVIVVINNTTDNSIEVVEKFQKKYPFINYINIPEYIGKGGAVTLGFKKARGEYVAFIDADSSSSAAELKRFYNQISKDKYWDGIIPNRYCKQAQIVGGIPLSRRFFSRAFNFIVRNAFGVNYKDTQCGLKIFKKEVAKDLAKRISTIGWTFDLNLLLLAKYLNYNIKEIPTVWEYKEGSKLNTFKALQSVTKELLKLKALEINLVISNFIDRHVNSKPIKPEKKLLIAADNNLWNIPAERKLLRDLSQDYGLFIFTPIEANKAANERVTPNIEFVRRGKPSTLESWFSLYYQIFLKKESNIVLNWNNALHQINPVGAAIPTVINFNSREFTDNDNALEHINNKLLQSSVDKDMSTILKPGLKGFVYFK